MRIIMVLFACLFTACLQSERTKVAVPAKVQASLKPLPFTCKNYAQKKQDAITLLRHSTLERDVLHQQMSRFITDSIIPCWYGTPWDFNGCTTVPGKGAIACGYFVTTVLKDAGLQLNRVKLAQQPSGVIIRQLCKNIKTFCNQPLQHLLTYVRENHPGLYIVGLDFHVGFINYDGANIYFIHSSYYGPKCVLKENASASAVLLTSKYRKIGRINFN